MSMSGASSRKVLQRMLVVMLLYASAPRGLPADEDAREPAAPQAPRAVWLITNEHFDQSIFGTFWNTGARGARQRLETLLERKLDSVEQLCGATESQRKKLRLAGLRDIARFYERVEELRAQLAGAKHDERVFKDLWQQLPAFRFELHSGLFNAGSLFDKTLHTALTAEQGARYDRTVAERSAFRYRARLATFVNDLDDELPLRAEQRRRLLELLFEETRPPRQYGVQDEPVILIQAADIPDERFAAFLDVDQTRLLRKMLQQPRVERAVLIRAGILQPPPAAEPNQKVE